MSRKIFVVIAGLAFLMCLFCMYFGSSIFNANDNIHVEHLNDMDRFSYYDVEEVPALTRLAAILTIPFLLAITILEIYVILKTKVRNTKRIAVAVFGIAIVLLILSTLTIKSPLNFDFSHWGFAWIFGGLFTVAGNGLSIFLKVK
jgi:hypothetical protein